jgi:hypothetical protein
MHTSPSALTLSQAAATRLPLAAGAGGLEGKAATRTVSLEGCSIAQRSKNAFDPSNPAGAYMINCGNEYGQSVLLTVVEMVRTPHAPDCLLLMGIRRSLF